MKKELKKRILTSMLLVSLILTCLYIGHPLIMIVLFLVSFIAYNEFQKLLDAAYQLSIVQRFATLALALFYFLFIFFVSSTSLAYDNIYIFILALSICVFSDIGGFTVGKIIKGPKLTKISPNKTISGSIGSVIHTINYFKLFFPRKFFIIKIKFIILL